MRIVRLGRLKISKDPLEIEPGISRLVTQCHDCSTFRPSLVECLAYFVTEMTVVPFVIRDKDFIWYWTECSQQLSFRGLFVLYTV